MGNLMTVNASYGLYAPGRPSIRLVLSSAYLYTCNITMNSVHLLW